MCILHQWTFFAPGLHCIFSIVCPSLQRIMPLVSGCLYQDVQGLFLQVSCRVNRIEESDNILAELVARWPSSPARIDDCHARQNLTLISPDSNANFKSRVVSYRHEHDKLRFNVSKRPNSLHGSRNPIGLDVL